LRLTFSLRLFEVIKPSIYESLTRAQCMKRELALRYCDTVLAERDYRIKCSFGAYDCCIFYRSQAALGISSLLLGFARNTGTDDRHDSTSACANQLTID
jgi:hypothetical protein